MSALADLVDRGLVAPDWAEALAPVDEQLAAALALVREEAAAGRTVLPADDLVLRAFRAPLAGVRVLLVGQDPYPTPGHPIGLSFAVERHVRPLPASLRNVYRELSSDLGVTPPEHGDLTAWAAQGVMLLNRVLTVRAGEAGSHRRRGWEPVTEHAVRVLAARAAAGQPMAAVLWGADARRLEPWLAPVPCVVSGHPSPLSANRGGFFGTRPFSTVDGLLLEQGADPIDWAAIGRPEE
ncbi:uracil-DNA glycosylase [Nocardioides litoris]|uniref:uracil-DNA glycosylase n=1 Tax=Nocardioides litoris TaxID=1926648 RepID=UPI00111FFB8C|nr:uracil-DNA glycosylase [Nocardioides litoris]